MTMWHLRPLLIDRYRGSHRFRSSELVNGMA